MTRLFLFADLLAGMTAGYCGAWLAMAYFRHWRAERMHQFPDAVDWRWYTLACLIALAWLRTGVT